MYLLLLFSLSLSFLSFPIFFLFVLKLLNIPDMWMGRVGGRGGWGVGEIILYLAFVTWFEGTSFCCWYISLCQGKTELQLFYFFFFFFFFFYFFIISFSLCLIQWTVKQRETMESVCFLSHFNKKVTVGLMNLFSLASLLFPFSTWSRSWWRSRSSQLPCVQIKCVV